MRYGEPAARQYADQFCELFHRLIPENQQMSPTIILGHAAEGRLEDLSRGHDTQSAVPPIGYFLYLAVQDDRVIGFLNLLVVERNYALIAYLGALPSTGSASWKMLQTAWHDHANTLKSPFALIFEIAPPVAESARSSAKARLFTEYSRLRGLATRKAPIDYIQPDMVHEETAGTTEQPADLYIASSPDALAAMSKQSYLRLVESIYFDVYVRTFRDLGEDYTRYISRLYEKLRARNEDIPSPSNSE
ncbi:hypothetical protein Aple_029890 [Acrocarpospora pleiomorpha]|uniref:Uncharacterized protein n=1 Tax=Acrocarpospora pleiomorpha TaxID=90975 RepID=A0A5M3XLQ7_9ACTN|nr:hypothetical protein Aple_029890 [Acrocarpospora pleiomorpha]